MTKSNKAIRACGWLAWATFMSLAVKYLVLNLRHIGDFRLFLAFGFLTGLCYNQWRWFKSDSEQVSLIMASVYLQMFFALWFATWGR